MAFPYSCFSSVTILNINKPRYINAVHNVDGDFSLCVNWNLNQRQIEKVFLLSDKYKEESDIMEGYWLWFPCEISGELMENNKKWHFIINAAATASWSDGKNTIYWGCSKEECDDMFILSYAGRGNPVY
ncbi:hypothetical protein CI266_005071 [Salmonella enterica subsp. enterica serovar Kotte]|nr:hypothetical protein [Salmonella enterica subsp. enterica serovar Kotte]